MPNYLLAYHGGGMPETEEEGAAVMAAWGAWMEGLGEALIDPGNPTGPSVTVAADGTQSPGGGANPVTGYSVLRAESLEAAAAAAAGCPIRDSGGSIEICEVVEAM